MLAELKREVGRLVRPDHGGGHRQDPDADDQRRLAEETAQATGVARSAELTMRRPSKTSATARQLFRLCLVDGRLDEDRVARRSSTARSRSATARHAARS